MMFRKKIVLLCPEKNILALRLREKNSLVFYRKKIKRLEQVPGGARIPPAGAIF